MKDRTAHARAWKLISAQLATMEAKPEEKPEAKPQAVEAPKKPRKGKVKKK